MMRTAWLGSAARRGLLPLLPVHQFAAPVWQVQCSADVHAMKLVDLEYAELELKSITHQVRFPLSYAVSFLTLYMRFLSAGTSIRISVFALSIKDVMKLNLVVFVMMNLHPKVGSTCVLHVFTGLYDEIEE